MTTAHTRPALHNALWPGLVGKGQGAEPIIAFDEMLRLTAGAQVDGRRFDGVDLFLTSPHVDIDSSKDDLERVAAQIASFNLKIGSLVAPVWTATGGGSAMGSLEDRRRFLLQVRKACGIGRVFRELGIRRGGVIRIDSAASPGEWAVNPAANSRLIAETFREACAIAEDHGERLAAEGEICWGAMHSWRHMVQLLEMVDRPKTLGFQADMAHTMLFALGYNAPEHRLLPEDFSWQDSTALRAALTSVANALRPWTLDFHVAQNDGTVKGSGSHDQTGRHCLPNDPNGRLDMVWYAGLWMRDQDGRSTHAFNHICWDGCMFPNHVMRDPRTWNEILATMIAVRNAHGWEESDSATGDPNA
jgi:sugar phosphate isomerase/epimerase